MGNFSYFSGGGSVGKLTLEFRQRLNRQESMSLETLWDVILGSKNGSPSWTIDGPSIEYFDGDRVILDLMKKSLEEKPWETEGFLNQADQPTREFIEEQEQQTNWFGSFLENVRTIHGKIVKVELT